MRWQLVVEKLRDPVVWGGIVQAIKTVLAAVLAWVLATDVLGLSQSFLAPWSAILVVQATVYPPPLQRRSTVAAIDQIDDKVGDLLVAMADGLDQGKVADEVHGWIERTRELDDDLDQSWALVRQARESARMNPRRPARGLRDPHEWNRLLLRLEQGVAESRSLARTIALGTDGVDDAFRRRWTVALREAGEAIQAADSKRLATVRETVRAIALAGPSEHADRWPVEGAALINLRNIIESFALITEVNPLSRPPIPLEGIRDFAIGRRGPLRRRRAR